MIEILIPTFNRAPFLGKNLTLLVNQILDAGLEDKISISISDNCSEDETATIAKQIIDTTQVQIKLHQQKENIGLERNAIFLLEQATDKFIMFLGDDDFLPPAYLEYLIAKILSNDNLSCVIPGINGLSLDGSLRPARKASFNEKMYNPSFSTVLKLSYLGHQLSGILLFRKNLYEKYTGNSELRNIYPFIFFVSFNNLRGITIYAPKFKVSVSESNSKDWSYDDSGLLTEVFKNYKLVFSDSYLKSNISNLVFMIRQPDRLRIGEHIKLSYRAVVHIEKDQHVDLLLKIILPFFVIMLYVSKTFLGIFRS